MKQGNNGEDEEGGKMRRVKRKQKVRKERVWKGKERNGKALRQS